jgi:hypothetical protein
MASPFDVLKFLQRIQQWLFCFSTHLLNFKMHIQVCPFKKPLLLLNCVSSNTHSVIIKVLFYSFN